MAFECGVLGNSGGRSAMSALVELLANVQSDVEGMSFEPIQSGEGWVATRVAVNGFDDTEPGQYVQVSVGGVILDLYLETARNALNESVLRGKDLMLTTILSGRVHEVMNERIMAYALNSWHGVPWDETSGFAYDED